MDTVLRDQAPAGQVVLADLEVIYRRERAGLPRCRRYRSAASPQVREWLDLDLLRRLAQRFGRDADRVADDLIGAVDE